METAEPAIRPFLGVSRSLTGRLWRERTCDIRLAQSLAERLSVPEVVGRILAHRGVDADEGEAFLNPTLRALLPDPAGLTDMEAAAARLAEAIEGDELVAVFGDYDVDGATSASLMKRYFDAVDGRLIAYIPDRLAEGYGPNTAALIGLKEKGASVVVTVDCGTVAFEPLAAAADAGLQTIVVDHHLAEAELPRAFAVVNPNRLDDTSGERGLAAVGVTFLLLVALNRRLRERGRFTAARSEPDLLQWLDLVALGTVCDVVPLVGLNRALVQQGLKVLARRENAGLAALADVARMRETPGTYHLGFLLGPRVNAGGRVGQANLGFRLLTTDDKTVAAEIAGELDRLNAERRDIERAVLDAALEQVESRIARDGVPPVIVAVGEGWHPGVIGIVASRLKDRFDRPTIVVGVDEEGIGKGSGRSIRGVDLGAAVTAARQAGLLINGGGHAMAAGLTVEVGKLGPLAAFLGKRLSAAVVEAGLTPSLGLDGALSVEGATTDLLDLIDQAGPYGAGNPEPRFALSPARIVRADVVGEGHVRCIVTGPAGGRIKAIAFRSMDDALGPALLAHHGAGFHLAGHLRSDTWHGERQAQFVIQDAAPAHAGA